jgi:hypothetical protein
MSPLDLRRDVPGSGQSLTFANVYAGVKEVDGSRRLVPPSTAAPLLRRSPCDPWIARLLVHELRVGYWNLV